MDTRKDRVVRIIATDKEWLALRKIALDRSSEIRELVTMAVRTAPVTREAFKP